MADNKSKKKSPFSIYWIYAIIGIALIGFQLFMSTGNKVPVESEDTFFNLAENGYVTDILLVNRIRVDFRLNSDGEKFIKASDDYQYRIIKESLTQGGGSSADPVYSVKILDASAFVSRKDELNTELRAAGKKTIQVASKEEINYFSNILSFLLPIIILLAIWMFV